MNMTAWRRSLSCLLTLSLMALSLGTLAACARSGAAVTQLPSPGIDIPIASGEQTQTVVFAGGCFWGIQAVYQHVRGVKSATSGYAGGTESTADYESVSSGATAHAEVVKVVYDPAQVSYGQLLRVFFQVAHDPTQLNRQGPDRGVQYRSGIFFTTPEQQRVAQAYIEQLQAANAFNQPIVTTVEPLQKFYIAEAYHQDYAARHPNDPYIVFNDAPKVANLKKQLPDLYAGS